MAQMSEFISCSMFHALGNGTVEHNHFRGTKGGTVLGTSFQEALFSYGFTCFSVERRGEQPWSKRLKSCSTTSLFGTKWNTFSYEKRMKHA